MDREQRGAGVNGDVRFGGERVRVRSLGVPRVSGERLVGALRARGRAVILTAVQSLRRAGSEAGELEWCRASGLAPGKRQQVSAVQGLRQAGLVV